MWLDYFIKAFVEQFPIFMIVITIIGLIGVIQFFRIDGGNQAPTDRNYILGAGLFALFLGLLVFPIETFQMIQAIKVAGASGPSIVMGGFYITFVPMIYGLFWFLISFTGWLYYKRRADSA